MSSSSLASSEDAFDRSPLAIYRMAASAVLGAAIVVFVLRPWEVRVRGVHIITIDYGTAPVLACIVLFASYVLTVGGVVLGLKGTPAIQPYTIIVIFFGLAYIACSFDHTGVFEFLALWAVKASGASARKLFFWFWVVSSVVTLLASNDVSILTVTPIICHFTRKMNLDPTPFILTQFMASNIWSMFLEIGNPTNIIVGVAYRMTFLGYSAWMALPSAVAGFLNFALLAFIFRKQIPAKIDVQIADIRPMSAIRDGFGAIFGCVVLIATIALLCGSTWIDIELWIICGGFALLAFAKDALSDIVLRRMCRRQRRLRDVDNGSIDLDALGVKEPEGSTAASDEQQQQQQQQQSVPQPEGHPEIFEFSDNVADAEIQQRSLLQKRLPQGAVSKKSPAIVRCAASLSKWYVRQFPTVSDVMDRMPWRILPFVLGMFVFVQCLSDVGWVRLAATGLSYISRWTVASVFIAGFVTCLAALVMNNQPMTILFTMILQDSHFVAPSSVVKAWMFGLVLGSNFCANFTVFGALAGIMWMAILKHHGVEMKELTFSKYGFLVMPAVTAVGLAVLAVELLYFPF